MVPSFDVLLACLDDHFAEEMTFIAVLALQLSEKPLEKLGVMGKGMATPKEKFRHLVPRNNDSDLVDCKHGFGLELGTTRTVSR